MLPELLSCFSLIDDFAIEKQVVCSRQNGQFSKDLTKKRLGKALPKGGATEHAALVFKPVLITAALSRAERAWASASRSLCHFSHILHPSPQILSQTWMMKPL